MKEFYKQIYTYSASKNICNFSHLLPTYLKKMQNCCEKKSDSTFHKQASSRLVPEMEISDENVHKQILVPETEER